MIFVFDWGHETRYVVGPIEISDAGVKRDDEFCWLVRVKTWFRAFLIPAIPTKTSYFFESNSGEILRELSHEEFQHWSILAHLNEEVRNEKIDRETYRKRREEWAARARA